MRVQPMVHAAEIARRVESEGIERPFRILVGMPEDCRMTICKLLGCHVRPDDGAEAQAWRIISENLRGLQARTHHLAEQLTPFSRNNNWWEIVTRAARRFGLRFYPGLKDEEVERLLFDHVATEFVQRLPASHAPELFVTELDPSVERAIASLDLGRDGSRLLVASLLRAASGDPREGANRMTDWVRSALPRSWTTSIRHGLLALRQRLVDVCEEWIETGFARGVSQNHRKVCTALALIYVHDRLDRTLEQVELFGL